MVVYVLVLGHPTWIDEALQYCQLAINWMLFYYRNAQRGLVETITHDLGWVMCILDLGSIRVEEFNFYTSLWSLSSLESITTSSPSTSANVTP